MIGVILVALSVSGGGRASADHAIGFALAPWLGLAVCVVIGIGGAAALLAACWRPGAQPPAAEAAGASVTPSSTAAQ